MGELTKEGQSRPVTQDDLALNERAMALQAQQPVPVMQHSGNPHEYLFFALFDGTGQDADNPKQEPTNVGHLYKQAEELARNPDNRVGYQYVEGIGTQHNPISRIVDGAIPYTWDDKIEDAYRALANQTKEWKEQDPDAQIRIAEVGYSRGAVLAPGLARLVDQYGIANPEDLKFGRDAQGNITVESPRPPLVPPGQTAQAMGLFDPVATNLPDNYDARLPASVISARSMTAAHERREAFPHQTIVEPGLSQDRRFVNVLMPGGHSNVGGGNSEPGLETQAFNQMADYLNGLSDKPLFQHRPLPDDPTLYTVYQARGATAVPGLDQDGLRNLRQTLANCKIVDPCHDAEPMNQALAAQFEYRHLPVDAAQLQQMRVLIDRASGQQQTTRQRVDEAHPAPTAPPQARAPTLPANFAPPLARQPADLRDPAHLGHSTYQDMLEKVRAFDAQGGHASGPHSERLAASLVAMQAQERLTISRVSLGANRQPQIEVRVRSADSYMLETRTRPIDARALADRPIEASSQAYLQARSPHFLSQAPAAERTPEQAQALAQLAPNDQILFARLREQLPAHISDDLALHTALQAKRAGIDTPEALRGVVVRGDQLHVAGTIPGFRTSVDLTQPAPPAQETMQQVQQYNLQREQELAASRGPEDPTRGRPTR